MVRGCFDERQVAGTFGEIERAKVGVRQFLLTQFSDLLKNEDFLESLPGNFPPDITGQDRVGMVLGYGRNPTIVLMARHCLASVVRR